MMNRSCWCYYMCCIQSWWSKVSEWFWRYHNSTVGYEHRDSLHGSLFFRVSLILWIFFFTSLMNVVYYKGIARSFKLGFVSSLVSWWQKTRLRSNFSFILTNHFSMFTILSSDSFCVCSTGSMDQTVIIWDSESGTQLCHFKGHKGAITSLDWEPLHRYKKFCCFLFKEKNSEASSV